MKRMKAIETSEIICEAIDSYYAEKGLPTPKWRTSRNDEWFRKYLIDLGLDPDNP